MTDSSNVSNPSGTNAQPGTAATSGTPTSSGNNGVQNTGFKYTADAGVPSWAVGRTALEVAQLAEQMRQQVLQGQPQPQQQYQQQQYQPAQQQQPAVGANAPTVDEWMREPDVAGRKLADFIRTQTLEPVAAQFGASLGETSRAMAELQDADSFKRWGPEIDMEIARYQPDPRTRTPSSIKMLVEMVRSRHVKDLVEEGVQERMKTLQNSGSIRADGFGGAPAGVAEPGKVDFNSLPPMYADRLQRHRVTEGTLREFFGNASMRASFTGNPSASLQECVDAWLKKASTGDLLTEAVF